jgi:hypothetical protein
MAILPKKMHIFHAISFKIPVIFITEIEKSTLTYIWKHRHQIAKAILSKKSIVGGITVPTSKYPTEL